MLDAHERARELLDDVAAIIDRLARRSAPPVAPIRDELGQQEMDLPEW